MGTRAGFTVFQDPKVNAHVSFRASASARRSLSPDARLYAYVDPQLKKVLNVWGDYLSSPESAAVLGTDNESWFSPHGIKSLEEVANKAGGTSKSFEELFHCDPKAEHYGYKSWDNFFTRLFRFEDGIRPVAEEDNDDVVVNACESKVYKVARDVKARDKFWIKGQVSTRHRVCE
jgi:phosphatidylserine decarboxylase